MGEIEYFVRGRASMATRRAGTSAESWLERMPGDPSVLKGLTGERAMERPLNALRDAGWFVFHDLVVGSRGANVDHLVIGRAGVFSINTKNLKGSVWVAPRAMLHNQFRTGYLPRAKSEAARVAERFARRGLNARVTPVLAVFCAKLTIKEMPNDVTVVEAEELTSWLGSLPQVINDPTARTLAIAADDPATWAPN